MSLSFSETNVTSVLASNTEYISLNLTKINFRFEHEHGKQGSDTVKRDAVSDFTSDIVKKSKLSY